MQRLRLTLRTGQRVLTLGGIIAQRADTGWLVGRNRNGSGCKRRRRGGSRNRSAGDFQCASGGRCRRRRLVVCKVGRCGRRAAAGERLR